MDLRLNLRPTVNAWLDEHNRKFGLFINNEWVTPKGAKYYASHDPFKW